MSLKKGNNFGEKYYRISLRLANYMTLFKAKDMIACFFKHVRREGKLQKV